MDNLIDHFLAEGRELVQSAGDDLAALADGGGNPATIANLFRAIHTLKGSTGLFDLAPLGDMLHAAEDLLGALRKAATAPDAAAVDALIRCVDQTGHWLDALQATGVLPADAPETGRRLQDLIRRQLTGGDPAAALAAEPAADRAWVDALLAGPIEAADDAPLIAIRYVPRPDCFFTGDDPVAVLKQVPGLAALSIAAREPWDLAEPFDPFRCNLVLAALTTAAAAEVQAALRLVADQSELVEVDPVRRREGKTANTAEAESARDLSSRTLRVDVDSIDALAHLADEIIVANNALAHLAARARNGLAGDALVQGLLASQIAHDRLSGALHRAVMKVRLVPLASLFRRFPRLVREIGDKLGKDLMLTLRGDGIEVDKSLVDGLFEPLLHLMRNAADHGIESPEQRRHAGKPARGSITLGATRVGDQVAIELADDGRGIDPGSIRRAVVERGLMPPGEVAALSDQEAIDLIFLPGFSTADAVTDLSGRGVGMDSVRTAVLKLGGRVTLASRPGAGTAVRLLLPMSVLLSNIIVVECAGERYGVPMDGIVETVRIPRVRALAVRNGQALVLRDAVIPILALADLLGLPPSAPTGDLRLLVVRRTTDVVAVAVDELSDRLTLLLRPMAGLLTGTPGVAGTALLGDGRVLMILDLPELIG
jgi:two-component system chemotaxis sensor kinase CheA